MRTSINETKKETTSRGSSSVMTVDEAIEFINKKMHYCIEKTNFVNLTIGNKFVCFRTELTRAQLAGKNGIIEMDDTYETICEALEAVNFNVTVDGKQFFCIPVLLQPAVKLSYGSLVMNTANDKNRLFVIRPTATGIILCSAEHGDDFVLEVPFE